MKRKLSPIYYIIPVIYICVILFFVFMQFRAREEFSAQVGSLSLSGMYAKNLGKEPGMRNLEVEFHDLRMEFSPASPVIAAFGAGRQRKLSLAAYSQFPDGFEIALSDEVYLRLSVEGTRGQRLVITTVIPPKLRGMKSLYLPFDAEAASAEAVKGIPVLILRGGEGMLLVSLPPGSEVDTEDGRLLVQVAEPNGSAALTVERVFEEADPYLYWFSPNLVEEETFTAAMDDFLDRAYQYWNGMFLNDAGSEVLIGELGSSMISEAAKRGDYRRILPLLSRNLRRSLAENAGNPAIYNSAAYLGNLPSFLEARQASAAEQTRRITDQIRKADFAVFEKNGLLQFILNHGPFSLAEEVLRLADSVDLEGAQTATLVHLVDVYLEALEHMKVAEATSERVSEIIDGHLFPAIRKIPGGLFLGAAEGGEADLYVSILCGRALVEAGRLLSQPSYSSVGRTLMHSGLNLADAEGFLPQTIRIRGGDVESTGVLVPPQSVYHLLPMQNYTPKEYPLYSYLYPGSWIWTVSELSAVKIDQAQYRFFFSFPTGDTHYLLIQGIRPMTSMLMHGIPWKSDPEYFRYTDGWVYDEQTQTLYVKLTHRLEEEELVLNY